MTPADGLLVSRNGVDLGTGLPIELNFRAPLGSANLTPLTTLASAIIIRHGVDTEQAVDQVRAAFDIDDSINLRAHNTPAAVNNRELNAIAVYRAIVQSRTTALLIARALAGSGLTTTSQAGNAAFDAMADQIHVNGSINLRDAGVINGLMQSTAAANWRQLDTES